MDCILQLAFNAGITEGLPEVGALRHRNVKELFRYSQVLNILCIYWLYFLIYVENARYTHWQDYFNYFCCS